MPSSPSRAAELQALIARPFAHRGLFAGEVVENSRAAFTAAIAGGYGIELDVRMSRDGVPFVLHDEQLGRLTGASGYVCNLDAASLAQTRLEPGGETLPRLVEILALIDGRVPLLIEVKSRGPEAAAASRAVEKALTGYHGPVGVMSFNPAVPRWFAAHAPVRLRGLVLGRRHLWLKALAGIAARPEFLACDVGVLPSHLLAAARRRGRPVIAWACRTREEWRIAETQADQIIFESEN